MWRDDGSLLDILHAAQDIQTFTRDLDEERFLRDGLIQSAVLKQLEIIGEAARRISAGFAADNPQVPWREMFSLRNRLVHEYDKVKMNVIWKAVQEDIPSLIELITPLIPPEDES